MLVLGGNSLARLTASSSDDVDRWALSNRLLRAKNLAFLGFSQSLSSELPLVVPLAISDLALARLGNALLLGGEGSGVEVFQIWLIHLSLLAASCCCSCRNLLVTALPCWSLTAWMASCIVLWTIAISGRGEYTDLIVRLPDSGEEGLEVSRELASLLASYSVAVSENISLWEDVWVLEESEL